MSRPYVLLSVAMSVDGHIDDASDVRLLLSNAADFDRVDQVRAESDAILIGAETMRRDNPRLLVNSDARRTQRVARGQPEYPLRVTITASGNLSRELRFWAYGGRRLVFTVDARLKKVTHEIGDVAEVVSLGERIDFGRLLDELGARGVARLMVEGGTQIHTQFLAQGLADELHLAVAPLLVGQPAAPRFLGEADYPGGPTRRMHLSEVSRVGDVALLRYLPKMITDEAA